MSPSPKKPLLLFALICFLGLLSMPASVDAGTPFTLTLKKSETEPLVGVKCYLFNGTGGYLGISATSSAAGTVSFNLSNGTYKIRADYLGYQFWSEIYSVPMSLSGTLTIPHEEVSVRVEGLNQASPDPIARLSVYLFNSTGSYLGQSRVSDSNGEVVFSLPDRGYKVRVDYLGRQFWSQTFQWQDTTVTIPMGDSEVTVTGSGLPLAGVKVYVFSAAGSYLGVSGTTDSAGKVVFELPAGSYKVRADYQGSQFWSVEEPVVGGQTSEVAISTGGGSFTFTVMKNETEPLVGANCYVFNGGGSYLGISGTSNALGEVTFNLSNGAYKFRTDYLGYQFWSDVYSVPTSFSGNLTIPHEDVVVRVAGLNQGAPETLDGVSVYLFSASGSYLGQSRVTNSSGEVIFNLPDRSYKVRSDYLGQQFWSEPFARQGITVTIPMGDSEVTVTGSGLPLAGVKVYAFSASGAYLGTSGTTDPLGKVVFSLPAGSYKYRADYQTNQYWTAAMALVGGQVNAVDISTGGGTFALTLMKNETEPLVGVNCYVFNSTGGYLGTSGTSSAGGTVSFNLSDGTYKFRVDYLGYQFWSENYTVPTSLSGRLTVFHRDVVISVAGVHQGTDPIAGVQVYLFAASGAYLGQSRVTNSSGEAAFSLPEQDYKVRADYLGQRFWSEVFRWQNATVSIPMGKADVTVSIAGNPLGGAQVYVFSAAGSYLGISGIADGNGNVFFTLPAGTYNFRADYLGDRYWSDASPLVAGQANPVLVPGTIQVPDLLGLSLSLAETAIAGAGLTVGNMTTENSTVVPEGHVISQNPWAGSLAQRGSAVDLVVSLGLPAAAPTVSVTATPAVIRAGEPSTLVWSSTYAGSCHIAPGIGNVDLSGTLSVSPMSTTTYTVTATGAGGTAIAAATVTVNSPPSILVVNPDGEEDPADTRFVIRWADDDPDDDAVISVYYDADQSGEDGTMIVTGLSEDADGSGGDEHLWDTSGVPEGSYFIYAVIDDGKNNPVVAYSMHPVNVYHGPPSVSEKGVTATDSLEGDKFGLSVSISGDYAVVGAPGCSEDGYESGAAYILAREAGWNQMVRLRPADVSEDYRFGDSVSIDGDYALIGAWGAASYTGAAYVFSRDGWNWIERAKLMATDAEQGDEFGRSVAIRGDFAIVGAPYHGNSAGAVYVFKREGLAWLQEAKLTAADAAENDEFGSSLAIDGDYVIVGAYASNEYRGAAYIFQKSGSSWTEIMKLTPSGETETLFGTSVAISGDYAMVGTSDFSDSTAFARFFKRDGSSWVEVSRLPAGNTHLQGELQISVSISGDYAVAGNPGDVHFTGSAYLFKRQESSWVEYTQLTAADGEPGDFFGASVSISGENIVVGAWADNDYAGSAYVYALGTTGPMAPFIAIVEPYGTENTVDARFTVRWIDSCSNANATISLYHDNNGEGMDGTLIVSGLRADSDGEGNDEFLWDTSLMPEGTYYIYAVIDDGVHDPVVNYSNGSVRVDHTKTSLGSSDPELGDRFGYAVAIDRDHLIVGAPGEEDAGEDSGSAYIYRRHAGWSQVAKLTAGDGEDYDAFGSSVAIKGDYAIVGTPSDDNYKGSAYVFAWDGITWTEVIKLTSSDAQTGDEFGWAVAIDGDHAVVGAYGDDNRAGSAYVFQKTGSTWNQVAKLIASDRSANDRFGWSVAIDGDYIVIGAWGKGVSLYGYGGVPRWGSVYVFKREGASWAEVEQLTIQHGITSFDGEGYRFGYSVAIDDPYIVVGAPGQDYEVGSPGAAYVFKREGEKWKNKATLTATVPTDYDYFGHSVAIDDDHAIVGAPLTCADGFCPGRAYTFQRRGETWTISEKLAYGETDANALFGASVAISGGFRVVGAPGSHGNTDYPGNVRLYLGSRVNISADYEEIVYGDSAIISWDVLDATSVTIVPEIGEVTQKGSIFVSPTQTTTYTITATGPWGTYSDSVTVVVAPFSISIQSPPDGDFFSRPDVRVEGAIRNPLGREIGVTINGVVAIVDSGHFVANHVPLEEGENTITVTAVDMDGNTETDSINVYVEEIGNYVRVTADPESGAPPFETTLRIEAPFNIANASLTYTGPNQVEFLDSPDPNQFNIRISTEGNFNFRIQAWDDQGDSYTDTVTVEAANVLQLDALLKAKWNEMKAALIARDIPKALKFHNESLRHKYETIYSLLGSDVAGKVAEMQDIELIFATGDRAKYRIRRNHNIRNQMITITYYIYFSKNQEGLWQIERY